MVSNFDELLKKEYTSSLRHTCFSNNSPSNDDILKKIMRKMREVEER
jgi:hypothetical protein